MLEFYDIHILEKDDIHLDRNRSLTLRNTDYIFTYVETYCWYTPNICVAGKYT